MTSLDQPLLEDAPDRVADLLAATRATLESDQRAQPLAAGLPSLDDSPTRIALAGPFNSGKSMLIAALLKLPQEKVDDLTAATPKTSDVTPYPWRDCVLLDLPGTLSGLSEHDDEAAAGVRRADLLLLVTSVELPGEGESAQIDHLLSVEGFSHRSLVVVNKANAEESDPEVVRAEMRSRLKAHPHVEVLFADARDYLDSLNFPDLDGDERALLREDSGIEAVEARLTDLATQRGSHARLLALCHEVRRTASQASLFWDADEAEETLELTADRIRLAFANAEAELADAVDMVLGTLEDDIIGIGTRLAAAVSEEDGTVDPQSASEAETQETNATRKCEEGLSQALNDHLSQLAQRLGTASIEWGRYYVGMESLSPQATTGSRDGRQRGKTDEVVDRVVDAALGTAKQKLDEFLRGGVTAGTPAHDLARKVNALLRKNPRAYTHIRMAEKLTKIGKAASTATAFLAPLGDLKGVVDNLRRSDMINKQRERIRTTYATHARAVVAEERDDVRSHIESVLTPLREAVAETLGAADASAEARLDARAKWQELTEQAHSLCLELDMALAL